MQLPRRLLGLLRPHLLWTLIIIDHASSLVRRKLFEATVVLDAFVGQQAVRSGTELLLPLVAQKVCQEFGYAWSELAVAKINPVYTYLSCHYVIEPVHRTFPDDQFALNAIREELLSPLGTPDCELLHQFMMTR